MSKKIFIDERLYAHYDANFNVTSLVKNTSSDPFAPTWNVAERFLYDPYGTATVFSSTYGSQSSGTHQWQHLHQGLRLEGSVGFYDNRHRWYSPSLGRFNRQDPLGYVDGMNTYEYLSSIVLGFVDPLGGQRVKIDGKDFETPISGDHNPDKDHPHTVSEADRKRLGLPDDVKDLGPHLHSVDRKLKYFPKFNVYLSKDGYTKGSNSVRKDYESNAKPIVDKKLRKLGLLGALALAALNTDPNNDELTKRIGKNYARLSMNVSRAEKDLSAAILYDDFSDLLGSEMAGQQIWNEIQDVLDGRTDG